MEDGVSSFPLFDLPNDPLKCVLQAMEVFYLMGLSILSKRSKELVKSLNLEVRRVVVNIGRSVSLKINISLASRIYLSFYTEQLADGIVTLTTQMFTPDFVIITDFEHDTCEWKKPGFEIKNWIEHFLSIFHHPKLDEIQFHTDNLFDLASLKKTINDVTSIVAYDRCPVTYFKQVLQTYPSAKQICLFFDNAKNPEDYHNILCQGLDLLTLCSRDQNAGQTRKLDDLLLMNSRTIEIWHSPLTEKDANCFLKHWIEGSNPRMERLFISFRQNFNPNRKMVLKGLNYHIVRPEQERIFEKATKRRNASKTAIVKGGYDIQRKDETIATIIFSGDQQTQYFNLSVYVWN